MEKCGGCTFRVREDFQEFGIIAVEIEFEICYNYFNAQMYFGF